MIDQAHDRPVRIPGKVFAAGMLRFQRGASSQTGHNTLLGNDIGKALPDTQIAIVGRCAGASAIRCMVGDGDRLDGMAGFDGRLQQCRMEVQYMAAVGGGAFRENRDVAAGVEQCGDFRIDDFRMATAASAQEHGFVLRREPSDDRPGADFRLRDEGRWAQGVDDENVEPGNVVGDEHAAGLDGCAGGVHFDTEQRKQLRGPALPQSPMRVRPRQRIDGEDGEQAPPDVQCEAQVAPATDGWCGCGADAGNEGGGIQSLRSMKCLA